MNLFHTTPHNKSLEDCAEKCHITGEGKIDGEFHINCDPCGSRAALRFPNKVQTKMNIFQNISYNFAQIHTIPASWSVQTQLILNPSLHLPPVELLLLLLTGAGANLAAAGAYGELSSCLEFAPVFLFEVNRQLAFPR